MRSFADTLLLSALVASLFCPMLAWAAYPPLQPLVDAAAKGSTFTSVPGIYAGPVVIDKPLTIDGRGQVVIDGGGKGTLVLLQTTGRPSRV